MSLKIFYDASKWVQGFFGVVHERSRAAKSGNLNNLLKLLFGRISVKYFA